MLECLLQRRGVSFALRFHLSAMTCFIHDFQNETDNLFLSPICPAACPCSVGECRLAILLQRREVAFPPNISNNSLFSSEFHDLPLTWESGAEVPSWLSGTYVRCETLELTVSSLLRNGPAQLSFNGNPRRKFTSWLDGFGKLHSFKFSGSKVTLADVISTFIQS